MGRFALALLFLCVGCVSAADPGADPECDRAECEILVTVNDKQVVENPPRLACRASVKGCFEEVCGGQTDFAKWCEPR